jgi:serine protease Do
MHMSVSSAFSTSCCPGVRRALPILACCLVLFGTVSAWAQGRSDTRNLSRSAPQVLAAFRTVVASTRASTVSILCGGKDVALGTVVEPDGWILTKASEVQDKPTCRLQDGRKLPARVVGIDDAWDLALLKVQAHGLRPVEWRDSKHVPVGFWLASVGLEEDPVAIGVVSVSARKSTPRPAPGGHDTAEYGYLGVMLEATEDGVRIASVMPGTPAEKAGLKKDDLVLTLAGKEVRDVEVFSNLVQQFKPGEVVALRFRRGDEEKLIQATLAKPDRAAEPHGR